MAVKFYQYRNNWDTITIHQHDIERTKDCSNFETEDRTEWYPYTMDADDIEHFDFERMLMDFFKEEDIEADIHCVQPMCWLRDDKFIECGFTVDYCQDGYDCRMAFHVEINGYRVFGSDLEELFPNVER